MQVQILKIARMNSDNRAKPLLKIAKPNFYGPSARAKPFLKIAKPNSYSSCTRAKPILTPARTILLQSHS
jgi:hypothetical protein